MKKLIAIVAAIAMVVAIVACGSSGGGSSDEPNQPENPPVNELGRAEIGLSIFALLHPNFPVQQAADLLRAGPANKKTAFAFVHNTFGSDASNYYYLQSELEGTDPHVQIYAICGPCRPPRRSNSDLVTFYPNMDADAFNWAFNDNGFRETFKNHLRVIKDRYVLPYPNSTFTIVPELESNFDNRSELIAFNLAQEVFADLPNVRIVVNPVDNPGDTERNGIEDVEWHTVNIYGTGVLELGDVLNFDGAVFLYPGETSHFSGYSGNSQADWESTKAIIQHNRDKGVLVFLWRPEWQGLHIRPTVLPDQREYTFLGRDAEIIELLNQ